MVHVDMRKPLAAAQEEGRRQVVGLREGGLTRDAIAVQTGLTRNGVFGICRRHAERGLAGLASGPRGPAPGTGRLLTPQQEAEVGSLIRPAPAGRVGPALCPVEPAESVGFARGCGAGAG